MIKILRTRDYKQMPWKNGGGLTTEIAVHPPQASIDDFGWRISMATVDHDGTFSEFPNVDRVLTMLDGAGMTLEVANKPQITLNIADQPYAFPADSHCTSQLTDGPITDFNVMTRRGTYQADVTLCTDVKSPSHCVEARFIFAAYGPLTGTYSSENFDLTERDMLFVQSSTSDDLIINSTSPWLDIWINPTS